MNKYFMLGLAGLAFAACSNEEDAIDNGNPMFDGNGAVSISIANPVMTRTASATTGTSVEVVPADDTEVVITLTDGNNDSSISLSKSDWEAGQVVTFWNVTNPTKVTVSMNNGIDSYAGVNIANGTPQLQVAPKFIPVYGETTTFTPTNRNESPTIGDDHETGAEDGDQNKKYQIWAATVNLEIPVARLEVSGIKHIDKGNSCIFTELTIDGVYLDNIMPTDGVARADYQWVANGGGTGAEAILKEVIPGDETAKNFKAANAEWPTQPQGSTYGEPSNVYAFNFYGPSEDEISTAEEVTDDPQTADVDEQKVAFQRLNPKFKIYFAKATGTPTEPVTEPRYAMITNYKDVDGNSIILKNGHIYRIVKAELEDKNIIGDEGGNTLLGVEVTVVEATWTVETIEADWAE